MGSGHSPPASAHRIPARRGTHAPVNAVPELAYVYRARAIYVDGPEDIICSDQPPKQRYVRRGSLRTALPCFVWVWLVGLEPIVPSSAPKSFRFPETTDLSILTTFTWCRAHPCIMRASAALLR